MKQMKRINKEIKLNINNSIDISYGTTNKLKPKVIYLTCKTWVQPKKEIDFGTEIENIFSSFKKKLSQEIIKTNFFDKNFISNFEITKSSLSVNKKNFFNFEIFLKQKGKTFLLPDIKENVIELFNPLINDLINDFKHNSLVLTRGRQ